MIPVTAYADPQTASAAETAVEETEMEEIELPLNGDDTPQQAEEFLELPEALKDIGTQAFAEMQSVKELLIPDAVTHIGIGIAENCPNLTHARLSASCRAINTKAFYNCNAFSSNSRLKEAVIPDSVNFIGSGAFSYCNALETLHLPAALETLNESSFNAIAVKSVIIPEGITEIPKTAFANNSNLISVIIPSSVKTISQAAFHNDTNLASVTFTGDLPYIYNNAFFYAEKLTWAIDPTTRADISKCKLSLSASSFTYTGKAQLPKVTVTYNGSQLSSANFTVTGQNNTKAGIATITVKGKNLLKGSTTRTVKICPTAAKITSTGNETSGVIVKWKKVADAAGYVIYRNGKAVKTINGNGTVSFKDTGAKSNGSVYTYKIRTFAKAKDGTKVYGAYSAETKGVYLSRPSLSLANKAAGKMTVKWNKNKKATGYQIKYVIGKTSKTVTVAKAATISKVLKIKKGKTCKVYVRSYKTYQGTKYYSPWSAAKTIKIKK